MPSSRSSDVSRIAAMKESRGTPSQDRARSATSNPIMPSVTVKRTSRPRPLFSVLTTLLQLASRSRSEEHTSELQSRLHLVCRLLLEKKKPIYRLRVDIAGSRPTEPRSAVDTHRHRAYSR